MRLLVLTSNSLRHFALIATLARHHRVTAMIQVPGAQPVTGPAQYAYGQRMHATERMLFHWVPWANVDVIACPLRTQTEAIPGRFDRAVVFGGGLIRGELLDQCEALQAINLHAGIAPEYRGTACNFWAAYDGHPELVGVTIHALTAAVDQGPVYTRVFAAAEDPDPWRRSMLAVHAAQDAVLEVLESKDSPTYIPGPLLRYSRTGDYTEAIVAEFMKRYV